MQLVAVPMAHVEEAWVQALPLIQRIADSAPDLTLARLWQVLRSGEGELWLAGTQEGGHRAAAITKLKAWSGETVAFVFGVASDDSRVWRQVIPRWHEALKARGAVKIISEGRKGWERQWPGARVVRQVYEVDL